MSDPDGQHHQLRDAVLTLAGIGVILALLRMSAAIVEPILLSLFIVAIASPALQGMRRRGISTGVSVFIGFGLVIIILGGISILLSGALSHLNEALPQYHEQLVLRTEKVDAWFAARGIDLHKGGVLHHFSPERLVVLVESIIAHLGSVLSNALLILFIVIFMLAEASHFPRKVSAMLGTGRDSAQTIARLLSDMKRYASTKAVVSAATGVLIWIGLRLMKIDYAELWAFLAFMLNFIPNVGSILAAVPAVLMAALQGSPLYVLAVVGLYLVVNVVIGNLVEPMLVGRRIGLSAVTVLLSLVFWGWMFGIVGMLLSVPLSMVVKAFAEAYPPTRWLSILMGPIPGEDGPSND